MKESRRIEAEWLNEASLQQLLTSLSSDGDSARIAGGAVRDALLGRAVTDVDIATTTLPEETMRRAAEAGFRTVPTGIEHGTVTVLLGQRAVEVTTLREDVETDGRHARVAFGRDWARDAERRDFTINALYTDAEGVVLDLVGGIADLEAKRLRFIGDAEQRIREDYLRILRFFRFFAWYGEGRPDAEGLKACARLKDGLARLSAERVWHELKRCLAAPDPSRALLWMRQAGVLTVILPETERWGIDAIHGLVTAERDLGWPADPLLRLMAIVPPDPARMAEMADRLKFSKAERLRLEDWARASVPKADKTESRLAVELYRGSPSAIADRLRLAQSAARWQATHGNDDALIAAGGYSRQLSYAAGWSRPRFPISGSDLQGWGYQAGPSLGVALRQLEDLWVESGFALDRAELEERARSTLRSHDRKS